MEKKILYSCDTGVDDALALAYLAGQKDCQVVGVTCSYGMSYVGDVFRNTKTALKLFGKPDIPVVMGSETPLSGEKLDFSGGSKFHGMSGIGGVLPPSTKADWGEAKPEDATDFIIGMIEQYGKELCWVTSGPMTDMARVLRKDPHAAEKVGSVYVMGTDFIIGMIEQYGKELCWVTSGPMTDMARVLRKDPHAAEKVGSVYVMGGALATPGNIGPASEVVTEANVRLDAEACKEVLESQLPLTLVGLDVTRKTLFTYEDHERWRQIGTKSALFLYEALKHYLGAYKQNHPYLNGCGLHDPLAAVAAVHPEILTTIPMHLTCFTEGPLRGRTTEDVWKCNDPEYHMQAAMFVDVKAFQREFFGTVEAMLKEH